MSLYRIDIFDCYIKEEYRKSITEVQNTKSWYSLLLPDVWENADELDRDTLPYFPDRKANWNEETGRFQICVAFNIWTYDFGEPLFFLENVLPLLCEDDKPLYHAWWDEPVCAHDYEYTVIEDLKNGRKAELGDVLDAVCNDFSEYENYFVDQEPGKTMKKDIPEYYYITGNGTLGSVRRAFETGAVPDSYEFEDFVKMVSDLNGKILYDIIDENGRLEVPEGVYQIDDYTFKGCQKLRSLVCPKYIRIGKGAFESCVNLENVSLSDNTYIGERAFSCCTSLKEIVIPKLMCYEYDNGFSAEFCIEPYTFFGCRSLEKVTFLKYVNLIKKRAFAMCESLNEIEMSFVRVINKGAFLGCRSLKKIDLPDGLTTIAADAFNYCTGLTEITIPESVKTIGSCVDHEIARALGGVVFNKDIRYFPGYGEPSELIENLTIKGKGRSCAQAYALYNGIKFEEV